MFVNVQITVMIYLTLLVFLVFVLLFPPINCLSYFFLQSLGQLVKCITQKKIQYSVNFILILLSSLQNRKLYFKQSVQRFLSVLPKFIKLWYCTYSYNIKKDSYIDSNIDDFLNIRVKINADPISKLFIASDIILMRKIIFKCICTSCLYF